MKAPNATAAAAAGGVDARIDDDGVLAAEFEHCSVQSLAGACADLPAGFDGSGEVDQLYLCVLGQRSPGARAAGHRPSP
ncbi:hypothetical protein GCM10009646_63690 [Streptomyces aureus]